MFRFLLVICTFLLSCFSTFACEDDLFFEECDSLHIEDKTAVIMLTDTHEYSEMYQSIINLAEAQKSIYKNVLVIFNGDYFNKSSVNIQNTYVTKSDEYYWNKKGDAYNNGDINNPAPKFRKLLGELKNKGSEVVLNIGNHELTNKQHLSKFIELLPNNVTVASNLNFDKGFASNKIKGSARFSNVVVLGDTLEYAPAKTQLEWENIFDNKLNRLKQNIKNAKQTDCLIVASHDSQSATKQLATSIYNSINTDNVLCITGHMHEELGSTKQKYENKNIQFITPKSGAYSAYIAIIDKNGALNNIYEQMLKAKKPW